MNKDKLIQKTYELILLSIQNNNKLIENNNFSNNINNIIKDVIKLISNKQFTIYLYKYIDQELNNVIEDNNEELYMLSELSSKMQEYFDTNLRNILYNYKITEEVLIDDHIQFFDDNKKLSIYGLQMINEIELKIFNIFL